MAVLYDPTGHALLSAKAQALGPDILLAYADAAERELGLKGTAFTGEDAATATLAVVYAINCALDRGPGGQLLQSEKKGDQSYTLMTSKIASSNEDWCTKARDLVEDLLGSIAEGDGAAVPRSATVENQVVW